MFSIDLAQQNFDDTQKKYINTILKLDDSKTIMLETRGEDIKVKNMTPLDFQVWEEIYIEYSEILEDENSTLFVNYTELDDIPLQTIITFQNSNLELQLISKTNDFYKLKCIKEGSTDLWMKLLFVDYEPKLSFLSERDKKNISRWIQSGISILSIGKIQSLDNVQDIRDFLMKNDGGWMKLFARVSQKMYSSNITSILNWIDGVIINHNDWDSLQDEHKFIASIKEKWKPVIIVLNQRDIDNKNLKEQLSKYLELGIDVLSISEQILNTIEEPLECIQEVFWLLADLEESQTSAIERTITSNWEFDENNYLINLLPKILEETKAKIVLCYSARGYTTGKIASLWLKVPLLVFTRDDFSYRYNNLLWGVKWYKISQTSSYEIFKQLGKEMIRIQFKGNISLDDKVVIINIREWEKNERLSWLINGIELYKFKNI